jgi:hypothetical protein
MHVSCPFENHPSSGHKRRLGAISAENAIPVTHGFQTHIGVPGVTLKLAPPTTVEPQALAGLPVRSSLSLNGFARSSSRWRGFSICEFAITYTAPQNFLQGG